jgi:hypothetical protein
MFCQSAKDKPKKETNTNGYTHRKFDNRKEHHPSVFTYEEKHVR